MWFDTKTKTRKGEEGRSQRESGQLEHPPIDRDGWGRVLRDSWRRTCHRLLACPVAETASFAGSLAEAVPRARTLLVVWENAVLVRNAGCWGCNPCRLVLVTLECAQDGLGTTAATGVHGGYWWRSAAALGRTGWETDCWDVGGARDECRLGDQLLVDRSFLEHAMAGCTLREGMAAGAG